MSDSKLGEAIEYFHKEQGLHRLLDLYIEKYRGYGTFGGTAKLSKLTIQEREALSSFMRKDYSKHQSVQIPFIKFHEALKKTRYADVDLKMLFDGYAGYCLSTKAEERNLSEIKWDAFIQKLRGCFSDKDSLSWLQHVARKGRGTKGIVQLFEKDETLAYACLHQVLSAIELLPKSQYERLPVFAHRVTRNPHAFDLDRDEGRLFVYALQYLRHMREPHQIMEAQLNAEEMNELYVKFYIIKDDILNFVTCIGITAYPEGEDQPLSVWHAACEERAVLNVPLREILRMNRCIPAAALQTGAEKAVFIIENSGLYSSIIGKLMNFGLDLPLPAIICSHGQFKLAALLLLDKLTQEGVTLYYSGDFDPEGLMMAQKLLKRYPGNVILWHMTCDDYIRCLSEETIDSERMKQLDKITEPVLFSLQYAMRTNPCAGYQEELLDDLLQDLVTFSKEG